MSLYSCQSPYYSYVVGGGFAVLFPSVYVNMYINIICRLDWIGLDVGVIGVLVFITMIGMLKKVDDSRK
ncbi:MAG TPA: hypothetical protein DEA91_24170 [Paenibacillus sp.]|nr:hypothetical protein [Paenibacillus sp.]